MKKFTEMSLITAMIMFLSGCGGASDKIEPAADTAAASPAALSETNPNDDGVGIKAENTDDSALEYKLLDDADIRNLKWGMSAEEVKIFEKEAELISEKTFDEEQMETDEKYKAVCGKTEAEYMSESGIPVPEKKQGSTLLYRINDNGRNIDINIPFVENEGMQSMTYRFEGSGSKGIFDDWKKRLTEKYGNHLSSIGDDNLYWYDSDKNLTVLLMYSGGYAALLDEWKKDYAENGYDFYKDLITETEKMLPLFPEFVSATISPGDNVYHPETSSASSGSLSEDEVWKLLRKNYNNPDLDVTYERLNSQDSDILDHLTINCESDDLLEITFSYWRGGLEFEDGEIVYNYDNFMTLKISKGSSKGKLSAASFVEPYFLTDAEIDLDAYTSGSKINWKESDAAAVKLMDKTFADLLTRTKEEFDKSGLGISLEDIGFIRFDK